MDIDKVVGYLDDIKSVSSSKSKEAMLLSAIDDIREIRYILNSAMADDVRFGVIVHPDDVFINNEQGRFLEVLQYAVENRPHNNNEKKKTLFSMIGSLPSDDERDLMIRVINKDLNIGIGVKTVNKVLKKIGLSAIRNLEPSKAYKEKDTDFEWMFEHGGTAVVQTKVDAARAYMVVIPNKEAYFLTSTGRRIDCLRHITSHHNMLSDDATTPIVIDGELVALDSNGGFMPRQKSNGLLNKAASGTLSNEDSLKFVFVAWDMMYSDPSDPEKVLYSGCKETDDSHYVIRFRRLERYVRYIESDTSSILPCGIRVVDSKIVYSVTDAYQIADDLIKKGEEGAIVKYPDSCYSPGRSREMVKIKKAFMADVRVTGVNEGKNPGTLGSLSYETDDGLIKGDVSGIAEYFKWAWWREPESIIGQIIEVRYMEVTTDKRTGAYTLYGPATFMRVRDDKKETSTLEELK